jgi:hypothetical protein
MRATLGASEMWAAGHSIETGASPDAIWRLWADVPGWPEWNADLARAELEGEFRGGSTIPQISGDFPEVLKALAERAER